MMDKALYIGTSGAKGEMHKLQMLSNNLANVNTTGFREDFETMKSIPVHAKGQQTRVYSGTASSYANFSHGPMITTGRDLDVALEGDGFFAVQSKTGREGYTRAGDFEIRNSVLTTHSGDVVMGTSGVVSIPGEAESLHIGSDGTISAKMKGAAQPVTINRLKLTNPPLHEMQKGTDGLFYLANGASARPDEKLKITTGTLEGSNVNTVQTLTELIELSRNFEMHTSLMKTLQTSASQANQIMSLSK